MKSFLKYIIVFIGFISASGCDEFLNEIPRSQLSPENLYYSAENAEAGILGIYSTLISQHSRNFYYATDLYSDDCHFGKNAEERNQFDRLNVQVTNPINNDNWSIGYRQIYFANAVIEGIERVKMNDVAKNDLIGEALFFRAYSYFNLVRWFGDIPLILSSEISDLNYPRVDEETVYAQIIADLEFSSKNILSKSVRQKNAARIFKESAMALLANVYLTRASSAFSKPDDFKKAADLAKEVIDSKQFDLMPEYEMAFDPAYKNGKEHLFSIQSDAALGLGLSLASEYTPRIIGSGTFGPFSSHQVFQNVCLTLDFFNSFEANDVRKTRHIWKDYIDMPDGTRKTFNKTIAPLHTGIYTTKYTDRAAITSPQNNNFPVIRYAGVLLLFAEADNEINGPTTSGYEAINKIRTRAKLPPLSGLTKESFREAIRSERRHELYVEGHRFFDLKRWGVFKERVQAAKPAFVFEMPKALRFPLPQNEIDNNSAISSNNPGY
jgi:starch-binding outer membrane protein, SusD/RagB family